MRLVYFAHVRERLGCGGEETGGLPARIETIGDLRGWLAGRGGVYAEIFGGGYELCAAADQDYARDETSVSGVEEVAFFPPVTGG